MLVIRDAGAEDVAAIADFWVSAWQGVLPEIDFERRRSWFGDHLAMLTAAGTAVLVACHGDRPIGFITIDPTGYVDQLAVAPAHQRSGIARALLDRARQRTPGRLTLTVNTDNRRAIAFYRRQGFVETGQGVSPHSGLAVLHMAG